MSVFGSKIGILHGTTGEWMLNVTNSPVRAYEAFDHFDRLTGKFSFFVNFMNL